MTVDTVTFQKRMGDSLPQKWWNTDSQLCKSEIDSVCVCCAVVVLVGVYVWSVCCLGSKKMNLSVCIPHVTKE